MGKIMKKIINVICCHFLYHVQYQNLSELENCKRCVICPNHSNVFDPTWIYAKVDNISIMAKSEIFKNPIIAKILKHYQVFPIRRGQVDAKSTLHAVHLFKEKEARLLIFPEGKVIKQADEIGKGKKGAIFIAATAEVPIIPIYLTRRPKLFSKVEVIIGEKIEVKKEVLENKKRIEEETEKLIQTIYQLGEKK